MTTNATDRQPFLIVETAPERLFRVARVNEADGVVSSSMPTGVWVERDKGHVAAGSLGVLVDNVLGYAVLVDRPLGHWSVSSEISIDMCAPVEPAATLFGDARPAHADSRGAVSSGQVVDERGRLVALCRQHGRYIENLPDLSAVDVPEPPGFDEPAHPGSVFELLSARPETSDERAVLDLVATPALVNPLHNMHGGITLCAADVTALAALESAGGPMATSSIQVNYIRPIPLGSSVRFEATVLHSGRTFGVARVDVRNAEGKVCAAATVAAGSR